MSMESTQLHHADCNGRIGSFRWGAERSNLTVTLARQCFLHLWARPQLWGIPLSTRKPSLLSTVKFDRPGHSRRGGARLCARTQNAVGGESTVLGEARSGQI
jgi:hypothetical protein